MSIPTDHPFDFDSTYGLGLDELRATKPPQGSLGSDEFRRACCVRVLGVNPQPRLGESGSSHSNWRVHDILYTSTDEFQIVTDTLLLTVASP
jgi:cephalosporin-C deacetylase